jgi:hypothetical protein
VNNRPVEFYTENIDMVDTKSSAQWNNCQTSAQQGGILERVIAHPDDWQETLKQERARARHMTCSATKYQQAMKRICQEPFIGLVVEHWNHAAEAARFDESLRLWIAIRKILDRMKDNRNLYYRISLAEKQFLEVCNGQEATLESLGRRLQCDARRAETLARLDDPVEYPIGVWDDSLSNIVSDYNSDEME